MPVDRQNHIQSRIQIAGFLPFLTLELTQSSRFVHRAASLSKSRSDKPSGHQALRVREKFDARLGRESAPPYLQSPDNSAARHRQFGQNKPAII